MTIRKSIARRIHDKSMWNRAILELSRDAGCYYCLAIYPASDIREWCGEPARDTGELKCVTAICPRCGVDSVLPGAAVRVTPKLLRQMQRRYFSFTRRA